MTCTFQYLLVFQNNAAVLWSEIDATHYCHLEFSFCQHVRQVGLCSFAMLNEQLEIASDELCDG